MPHVLRPGRLISCLQLSHLYLLPLPHGFLTLTLLYWNANNSQFLSTATQTGNTYMMTTAHDEEAGYGRQRHMSVSHYANEIDPAGAPEYGRRRSSVMPARNDITASSQKTGVLNQKDDTFRKMSVAVPNLAELSADAKEAAQRERNMGFLEGCRLYPKAMFFSFALSLAVIMEGYDTALLGNFYGIPAFAKKFGHPAGIKNGVQTYQVSASWQSALGNGTAAAQIIGLFINGILAERMGYRKMMMGSLVLVACCIFITFFAVDVKMLLAGYILSGLPW